MRSFSSGICSRLFRIAPMILSVRAALGLWSIQAQSPTYDEPPHQMNGGAPQERGSELRTMYCMGDCPIECSYILAGRL